MFIPVPGSGFFLIPDPGAKKALDFGSVSAKLIPTHERHQSPLSFNLYTIVNFKIITEKIPYRFS
jgi:hypothetical protein